MKKVLLFLVMLLLVLVSARSLFCCTSSKRYNRDFVVRKPHRTRRAVEVSKKEHVDAKKTVKKKYKKKESLKKHKKKSKKKASKKTKATKKKKTKKVTTKKKATKKTKATKKKKTKKTTTKKKAPKKTKATKKKKTKKVTTKKKHPKKTKTTKKKKTKKVVKLKGVDLLEHKVAQLKKEVADLRQEDEARQLAENQIKTSVIKDLGFDVGYAIETDNDIEQVRKSRLQRMVEQVISSPMDSASLDGVLSLLDGELELVQAVLKNSTGGWISSLRKKRDRLMDSVTQPALLGYQAIMNFATDDFALDSQINSGRKKVALKAGQQRRYLKRLCRVLERYRMELKHKQSQPLYAQNVLPKDRYQKYVAPSMHVGLKKDGELNTAIDVVDVQTDSHVERHPYFCSLITRSGEFVHDLSFANRSMTDSFKSFKKRFADTWNKNLYSLSSKEVVKIADNVLALVSDEVQNHSESLGQRKKMFAGSVDLQTNIVVSGTVVPSCKKSNILFGTIKDAAALNTVSIGHWNPDMYEENLRRYAKQLKIFANNIEAACAQKGQSECFGSCCTMRRSLDTLVSSIVYSTFASNV